MAKKNNTLLYVGIGCGVLLLLAGIASVAIGFYVVEKAGEFKAGITNPAEGAKRVLGSSQMPPGYYPQMAISIPFVMDMAIISNQPKATDEDVNEGDDGMFYFNMKINIANEQERQDLVAYFRGDHQDASALAENGININTDEVVNYGNFDVNGQKVLYVVQRGNIQFDSGQQAQTNKGLNVLFLVQCPQDQKTRVGFRYGPDHSPGTLTEELDLTGSVAEPAALMDFLGHFSFCPAPNN